MDLSDSQPAKRRKLSDDNDLECLPPALSKSKFVTLAKAVLELHSSESDGAQKRLQPQEDGSCTAVLIKKSEEKHNAYILSTGGTPRTGCVATLTSANGSAERAILEDALRLESTCRLADKPVTPLAFCHAALYTRAYKTCLSVRLLWEDSVVPRDKIDPIHRDLLKRYLPGQCTPALVPALWEPRDFYDNVHIPEKNPEASAPIQIDRLTSELFPFQRRTVRWMLSREGVAVDSAGRVTPVSTGQESDLPRGFSQLRCREDKICYVNHALGLVCSSLQNIQSKFSTIAGGLLADEMGLGKTLSVIGVVCLHSRPDVDSEIPKGRPQKSRATLIITPPTLCEQWKQELQSHAPDLKVSHYQGTAALTRKNTSLAIAELADNDIVLTTYKVIAKEVHYVAEKPDRSLRRKQPQYKTPKSPLTEISWWRICLDEAQMVESGVSAAATVARLIPREISWAVTGTPVRKGHQDLWGLTVFLRYEPWCQSKRLWDYLVGYHRPLIRSLINEIAIRHSKDYVREDLRLPPQSRHTITLPFTAVEEQHYDQLCTEMCEDIGLDRTGAPLNEEWNPEDPDTVDKMRRWLTRLRQTCLHPEIGERNRRALGRNAGPLRTVQQVLDTMIEQNETIIRTEQRSLLISRIRRGQLQENAKNTQAALDIWKSAYGESCTIVDECREQLNKEAGIQQENDRSRKAAEAAKEEVRESDDEEDGDDGEDEDEEADSRLQVFRQRLRTALEVKHICIFFMANAYFQFKTDETIIKPDSEGFHALEKQETDAYDIAKRVRGELLADVLRKANRLIAKVRTKADQQTLALIPDVQAPKEYTGIESRKFFDKLQDFCEAMNAQARMFRELRLKMVDLLRQVLIDEDEGVELKGDEYESSTKDQDEMYALMEVLRALFADRSDAISGQENLLIRQEMKGFLKRAREGEGPAPELMVKLLVERDLLRIDPHKKGSLRGIVAEIRQLVTSLEFAEAGGSSRARAELEIAQKLLKDAQTLVTAQNKALSPLEQEVNLFRDTMNRRLDFYRALQKISDTVAPYDEANIDKPLDLAVYNQLQDQECRLSDKISTTLSKRRYLVHLKTESDNTSRICTICQSDFDTGTLTVCGHQFCKDCIRLWYQEHHNCPVCKRRLVISDFHDITYKPAEMAVQAESTPSGSESPGLVNYDTSRSQAIYSDISTRTLNEIKNIELQGGASFGSKVDMLIRHLLWLRENDPGTKSIIFSQYREFLQVLGRAFKQFKISSSAFDDKNGVEKFKSDPSVECFLLHAKAHSAGLNLVCASHVFLCEPLLATAVELQAIARVHRIGQHRATTVFMYIIGGTVEESIYEMSVERRLAHIDRSVKGKGKTGKSRATSVKTSGISTPNGNNLQEAAIDLANSLELQAADLSKMLAAGKGGGELVAKEDLWQSLYGKVKKREVVMRPEDLPAGGRLGALLRAEAAEERNREEVE